MNKLISFLLIFSLLFPQEVCEGQCYTDEEARNIELYITELEQNGGKDSLISSRAFFLLCKVFLVPFFFFSLALRSFFTLFNVSSSLPIFSALRPAPFPLKNATRIPPNKTRNPITYFLILLNTTFYRQEVYQILV